MERHSTRDAGASEALAPQRRGEVAWAAALLGVLAAFLVVFERRQPYYFLQDDNRTAQLGLLADWLRGLHSGELPLYNFHQYLGMPTFAVGPVAVFYPPLYLAALLSEGLFGHLDGAIDIAVAMHLAVGLLGMHRLLRALGLGTAAAAFGALTWPLCSMVVFAASSWWHITGIVAFFPWLLLLGLRTVGALPRRSLAANVIALVGVRTLLVYVGHVQLFVYSCLFEILAVTIAVAVRADGGGLRGRLRALVPYLLSLYLTAALALPFVLPLWHATAQSAERAAALPYSEFHDGSYDLVSWLAGAVDPYHWGGGYYAAPIWLSFARALPYLSFTGHLTLVLLAVSPWLLRRHGTARLPLRVLVVPLLVAFVWMTGSLDRALYLVPLLNRFRLQFKLELFVAFFSLVVAAISLDAALRWLGELFSPRRAAMGAAAALALHFASLEVLYGSFPTRPFNYRRMTERPPLVEPLAGRLRDGRVVSLGYLTADPHAAAQLGFDYASLFGLFQYAGYGNLLSADHARHVRGQEDPHGERPRADGVYKLPTVPFDELRRWGVAWYVLGRNAEEPAETRHYQALLAAHGATVVAADARRIVFHDAGAQPLLYLAEPRSALAAALPLEPLEPKLGGRSLRVCFAPVARPRQLVAGFLAVPGFRATDGRGHALRLDRDGDGRIVVDVPAGTTEVTLIHDELALAAGARAGALLAALPLLALALARIARS